MHQPGDVDDGFRIHASKTMYALPLKPRDFYDARSKSIIKDLRKSQGVSYKELARRLESYGVVVDDRVLINRINRGGFSFAFALQVLAALGAETISVPKPTELPKPEVRTTRV